MSERIHKIFTEVSKDYDMVNTVSSFGTIVLWRRTAAKEAILEKQRYDLLNIATGTGELAFEISKAAKRNGKDIDITGIDFTYNMLKVAKEKAKNRKIGIKFQLGNAMDLKFKNSQFDIVTSAFALRNVDSLDDFAEEAYRVLKKGGRGVFMDMARPDNELNRLFIKAYWALVAGIGHMENSDAYKWLQESVDRFNKRKFVETLKKAGFKNVKIRDVFSGAAFLVTADK